MKDDLAFKQSKRLGHTRAYVWDLFAEIAQMGVKGAGGAAKVFGTKPSVVKYKPTDITEETGKAVAGNIKNYPQIQKLLETILPGYSETMATGMKAAKEMSRGEIPSDVQDYVRRTSAFKTLMGGFGGMFGKALAARDLGQTSMDMQTRGQNAAQRWAALASGLSSPYMVGAPLAIESSFANKARQQGTEQMAENWKAAADPGAAGTFALQAAMGSTALSMGFSALGGMASGGTPPTPPPSNPTPTLGQNAGGGALGGGGGGGGGGNFGVTPYYAPPDSQVGSNMHYQPWYMPQTQSPPGYGQGQGVFPYEGGG